MKPNHLLKVSNFKLGKIFSLLLFCFVAILLSEFLTHEVDAIGLSPPRISTELIVGVQTPITVKLIRSQGEVGDINMVVDLSGDMKEVFVGQPRFTIPEYVDVYEYTFYLKPIHYKEAGQNLYVLFINESMGVSGETVDDSEDYSVSINSGVALALLYTINEDVVDMEDKVKHISWGKSGPQKKTEEKKEETDTDVKVYESDPSTYHVGDVNIEKPIKQKESKEKDVIVIKKDEFIPTAEQPKTVSGEDIKEEKVKLIREIDAHAVVIEFGVADLNKDGEVGLQDVFIIKNDFLKEGELDSDLDKNSIVATRDLSVLLSNWTEEIPIKKKQPPVPPGPPLKEDMVVLHSIADDKGSGLFIAASLSFVDRRDTFKTYVMMDTGVLAANASEMDFYYDSEVMTLINIDIDSSIFTVWIEEPHEVAPGHIRLIGGAPDGFSGTDGVIVELEFEKHKDKLYAPTALTFSDDVKVYKKNGESFINILTQGAKSIFEDETIMGRFEELGMKKPLKEKDLEVPEKLEPLLLRSSTHPYGNRWYKNKEVTINWSKSKVEYVSEEYLYLFTKQDKVELEDLMWSTEDTKARFLVYEEGIWYFHAARVVLGKIGEVHSFPVYLDLTGPELLYSRVEKRDVGDIQKKQFLIFNTIDRLSGTDHFLIKRGGKTIKLETGVYELPKLSTGTHIFKLQSVDAVGNISNHSVSIEVYSKPLPWNIIFTIIALCLVLMLRLIKFAVDKSKIKKLSEAV